MPAVVFEALVVDPRNTGLTARIVSVPGSFGRADVQLVQLDEAREVTADTLPRALAAVLQVYPDSGRTTKTGVAEFAAYLTTAEVIPVLRSPIRLESLAGLTGACSALDGLLAGHHVVALICVFGVVFVTGGTARGLAERIRRIARDLASGKPTARAIYPRRVVVRKPRRGHRDEFLRWVEEALVSLGGEARVSDVAREIWRRHHTEIEKQGNQAYTWQYDMRWAATQLRQMGRLRPVDRSKLWKLGGGAASSLPSP